MYLIIAENLLIRSAHSTSHKDYDGDNDYSHLLNDENDDIFLDPAIDQAIRLNIKNMNSDNNGQFTLENFNVIIFNCFTNNLF